MNKKVTIGGSEIAAVMGLSRWQSPLRLWAEKTGKVEREDISGKEYVELGTELEDFVAQKFARKTGKKVRRDRKTFKYRLYSYMTGHIDRRIVGTDELLECKTCNAWKEHEWEGEDIPMEYILQVMWYLGVCGMSKGYIAVLIGGQKFRWKEIVFDIDLFAKMVAAAKEFVEYYVQKDIAPIAVAGDGETLMKLTPENTASILQSEDPEVNTLIEEKQACARIIKEAEKNKDDIDSKLKQRIGDHEGIETGLFKATWKSQSTRRISTAKIKEDGLYDKYAVESFSRVLRIAKKKG